MNVSLFGRVNRTQVELYIRPTTGSRRKDLQGLRVPCAVVVSINFTVHIICEYLIIIWHDILQYAYPEVFAGNNDPITDHVDIITKSTVPIGFILREDLNMSCDLIQVDNYGWLHNGTWNGAIGLFASKRIKALAYGTIMLAERLMVSEFTGEIFRLG